MEIDVKVLNDGIHVNDALDRQRRMTPVGYTGVLYRGRVYVVMIDTEGSKVIDTIRENFDESECFFQDLKESSSFQDSRKTDSSEYSEFQIETNDFGHYLIFDGDENFYNNLKAGLKVNLLPIVTGGECYRPAEDGRLYDWYIRFDRDFPQTKLKKKVNESFSSLVNGDMSKLYSDGGDSLKDIPDNRDGSDNSAVVDELRQIIHSKGKYNEDLQAKLDTSFDENQNLKEELHKVVHKFALKEKKLNKQIIDLSIKISSLKDNFQVDLTETDRILKQEISELTKLLAYGDEELEQLEINFYTKEQLLKNQVADLESRNKYLSDKVQQNSDEVIKPSKGFHSKSAKKLIYELALNVFSRFKNLVLSEDSYSVILNELRSVKSLLRNLEGLDADKIKSVAVKGRKELFEVLSHIHTGRPEAADMGRLYWKKQLDGQKLVFFHMKRDDKEQRVFLKAIK